MSKADKRAGLFAIITKDTANKLMAVIHNKPIKICSAPKNIGDQAQFIKIYEPYSIFNLLDALTCHKFQPAIAIKIYKIVHIIGKIQFGGLKFGLFND